MSFFLAFVIYWPYQINNFRYPTFGSAVRDLDDALCLCFVFATLPHTKIIKAELIESCRKLTAEFMHYIIEAQCVRNTFISIKVTLFLRSSSDKAMMYMIFLSF